MRTLTPEQRHRREVRNTITLPMLAVLALMVIGMVLVILALSPLKFSIVADSMLTWFILLPTALLCLIPTIIMMAIATGAWKLNAIAARPLARLRNKAIDGLSRVQQQVPRLATPVVHLQSRFSYLERMVTGQSRAGQFEASEEEQLNDN